MRSLLLALTLVSVTSAYNQLCTPGTHFTNDCNTCVCTYQGKAVCTTKACQSGYYKPGSSFKDPLDDVHHVIPGTKNIEITPSNQIGESHSAFFQVCTPNAFFYVGCNRCWCSVFGETYTCTKFSCGTTQPNTNLPGHNQFPQQNTPNYPSINKPNQQYPQQNVPNYPYPNNPSQQNPQQHIPNYPNVNKPNQQYPQQNAPNYPAPNKPNQQYPQPNYPNVNQPTHQYPQQNYPTPNQPNQHYPQQNIPNYPSLNNPNQQYPQQNEPSYPIPNQPNQQYPQQNTPNYPAPNAPNLPYKPPQPSPSFPDPNENGQQQNPLPTFPVPNVPNPQQPTQKPDQHHKHLHGCGHHHKRAAKQN